ncbi:MAG: glycosyl hydrolase family 18 protein [Lysinibacillus sp.]
MMLLLVAGCSGVKTTTIAKEKPIAKMTKPALSIWLPEWQYKQSISEVKSSVGGLKNIYVFGAYFNEKDQLFLTDTAIQLMNQAQQQFSATNKVILTVINDYVVAGSPSVQKDSELLHRLLESPKARKQHIANIMELADRYKVDGIEVDYEKIAKNDLPNYVLFLDELYQQLKKKNKSMHVVVVPSFPFEMELPNGPEYTVMAYNVHGYHSGAGAKADFKFLDQLMGKVQKSNQKFAFAFATGGFVWKEDGKIVALTEVEAEKLLTSVKVTPQRDKASGALFAQYVDENNKKNEVWYADTITLQKWVAHVGAKKFKDIVLWRAGGLSEETVNWLKSNKK